MFISFINLNLKWKFTDMAQGAFIFVSVCIGQGRQTKVDIVSSRATSATDDKWREYEREYERDLQLLESIHKVIEVHGSIPGWGNYFIISRPPSWTN